jgi:glycyl-tRNA synthetase beta chain
VPSGSKDPFGLRRQANGIVKTIAEHKLPVKLSALVEDAKVRYRGSDAEKKFAKEFKFDAAVRGFFRERLEFYLRDARGFAYDVVNAVLAADADDVVDGLARAEAVSKVRTSSDFEAISTSFKRTKNILRQASEACREVAPQVDAALLQEDSEKALAAEVPEAAKKVEALRADRNYEKALLEIGKLRPALDHFFEKVMVMAEDAKVRANRLALLQTLLKEFSTIADFSEIVTEGKESSKQ